MKHILCLGLTYQTDMYCRLRYILLLFLFHQRDTVYGISKHYLGCYFDQGKETGIRTLPYGILYDNNMTNDMCVSHCCSVLHGATFMGTQAWQECYCSNVASSDNFVQSRPRECNMPCDGNPREICGGSWKLSLHSIECSPETTIPSYLPTTSIPNVTTESTLVVNSPSNCLQINNTVWTEEELAENLYLLRNTISINKKETYLYKATKKSAYDPRKSSRNIGIVGVIVLVVPVIIVVIMDVHRICQ